MPTNPKPEEPNLKAEFSRELPRRLQLFNNFSIKVFLC